MAATACSFRQALWERSMATKASIPAPCDKKRHPSTSRVHSADADSITSSRSYGSSTPPVTQIVTMRTLEDTQDMRK